MTLWWTEVFRTIHAEFSDLPTAAGLTRVVLRLLMAAVLGGVLGFQREHQGKSAGLRTHMLVSLGAAIFVLIPQQFGIANGDLSRVIQGVIAGIGFLGAGTILKDHSAARVRGLTTAAGIWLTEAVGIAAGLGRESSAVLSTLMALGILSSSHRLVRWLAREERGRRAREAGVKA